MTTHPAALLRNSLRAYGRDFRRWLLLTVPLALVSAVILVLSSLVPQDESGNVILPDAIAKAPPGYVLLTVIAAILLLIAIARIYTNAAVVSAAQGLGGGKLNVKGAYHVALKAFWRVLWVAILRGLIVTGGLLLFIVPGIIWGLRYSLATQVALLEDKGGLNALRRSRELTKGKLLETLINFGVLGAIIGYGVWLAMLAALLFFIILAGLVALFLPASTYETLYAVAGILVVIAEAGIAWVSLPLSPLAFVSIYKDFSSKTL